MELTYAKRTQISESAESIARERAAATFVPAIASSHFTESALGVQGVEFVPVFVDDSTATEFERGSELARIDRERSI